MTTMSHHHNKKPQGEQPGASDAPVQPDQANGGAAEAEVERAGEGLAAELDGLRAEHDKLNDRFLRLAADYQNYQRRIQREMDDVRGYGASSLIKDLLGVLDDLDRALQAGLAAHGPDDAMVKGVEMVVSKALETLKRHGVEVIDAAGKPFDPEQHHALAQTPSDEVQTPTVQQELQRGYTLRGRVLRPAGVLVAMPKENV
jgi:molecular chaperone GrpE